MGKDERPQGRVQQHQGRAVSLVLRGHKMRSRTGVQQPGASFYLANDKFSVDGQSIRIPKLGTINMAEALRFTGKILSAVISYRAGWWFVAISVEVKHEVPIHTGEAVGIDLGI